MRGSIDEYETWADLAGAGSKNNPKRVVEDNVTQDTDGEAIEMPSNIPLTFELKQSSFQ